MDQAERATYSSDINIAERYMAENTGVEIILPTITLEFRNYVTGPGVEAAYSMQQLIDEH